MILSCILSKVPKLIIFWFSLDIMSIAYLKIEDDISCYNTVEGNVLPTVDDEYFSPPENSIYFHETSCKGGLNLRQACTVESAAKANPSSQIYVIFSAPISKKALSHDNLQQLKKFDNVKFLRLHLLNTTKNTPVEGLVLSGALNRSKQRISRTSELLRFLTLYKWGGIYLDLDMIVAKPLERMGKNWVVLESEQLIGSAALAFSSDESGRIIANASILEFAKTYIGDLWTNNGPRVITRVLKKMYPTINSIASKKKKLKGFKVYDLMSISYKYADEYFKPGYMNLYEPYLYHIWGSVTSKISTNISNSRYMQLAKKFCPLFYENYGIKLTGRQD